MELFQPHDGARSLPDHSTHQPRGLRRANLRQPLQSSVSSLGATGGMGLGSRLGEKFRSIPAFPCRRVSTGVSGIGARTPGEFYLGTSECGCHHRRNRVFRDANTLALWEPSNRTQYGQGFSLSHALTVFALSASTERQSPNGQSRRSPPRDTQCQCGSKSATFRVVFSETSFVRAIATPENHEPSNRGIYFPIAHIRSPMHLAHCKDQSRTPIAPSCPSESGEA
jgi:hypothetical protein